MWLRSRWLYLALLAVILGSYARLMTLPGRSLRAEQTTRIDRRPMEDPVQELTLDRAHLAAFLQQRPRAVLMLLGCMVIGGSLGVMGLVLSFRAAMSGRLPRLLRQRSRLPSLWSMADVMRIILLLLTVVAMWPLVRIAAEAWGVRMASDAHAWSVVSMLIVDVFAILTIAAFASSLPKSLRGSFGFSARRAARGIPRSLVGYAGIFPWIFGLLWAIATVCQWFGIRPPVEPVQELLFFEPRAWVVGLTVFLACVVGPIAEELVFRGVIFSAVRKRTGRWIAMLVSGALFSGLHTNAIGFVPILLLGVFLAFLYEFTGTLLAPMAVHILHNTFLIGIALAAKQLL